MFSSSGAIWNLLTILLPNYFGMLFFFIMLFWIALVTFLGYFMVTLIKDEHAGLRLYWSLLWRNEISTIAGRYIGIIVSMIFAFILSDTLLGIVGSEFPLTTPTELSINLTYVVFTCVLCSFLAFISNYWIALKRKIQDARKRFWFCLLSSAAYGIALFLELLIFNPIK